MSTSSYSQPKRSAPINYLLIFQDMTHEFVGATPQSLDDNPVSICTSYSLSFFYNSSAFCGAYKNVGSLLMF